MDLTNIQNAIAGLTPDQFTDLSRWFYQEGDRRRAGAHADAGRAEVIGGLRDDGTIDSPTGDPASGDVAAWVDPGTIHTRMYLQGDVVAHQGRVWRSEHRGLNHWEPGGVGIDARIWLDVTPEEEPEDGVIDFRAGYPVSPGDIVRYNDVLYEVIQAHTMADHWPPHSAHSLFKAV